MREETESLAPYAVEIRYPGDVPEISLEEVRKALAAAEAVWDFVLGLLLRELRVSISEGDRE